jgi:hypothetical protein
MTSSERRRGCSSSVALGLGAALSRWQSLTGIYTRVYTLLSVLPRARPTKGWRRIREGWHDQGSQRYDPLAAHSTRRPPRPASAPAASPGSRDLVLDLAASRRVPEPRELAVLCARWRAGVRQPSTGGRGQGGLCPVSRPDALRALRAHHPSVPWRLGRPGRGRPPSVRHR